MLAWCFALSETKTAINPSDIYCGVKPCGCVVMLMSQQMAAKDLAKEMASVVKAGFTVQLLPRAEALERFGACKCGKVAPTVRAREQLGLFEEAAT